MATEFVLPVLGDGIDGGTLVKILVSEGDTVEENQNVLELETDKAVLEVPSTVSGTIKTITVKEGAKIKIGESVFTVEESASASNGAPAKEKEKADAASSTPPITGEEEVDTETESTPSESTPVEEKSAESIPAPDSTIEQKTPAATTSAAGGEEYSPVPASPSTRRFAREIGVDIQSVPGSGPGGRISESDVKNRAREVISSGGGAASVSTPASPLPDFSKFGAIETEEFSNVRRATSNQMTRSWQAPHVTQFDKADITQLEKLRKQYASRAEQRGGKLTVTAILVKVIVAALKRFPQFNSSLDLANEQLILKKYYNVGVAVDTERGLLVPVIKNADRKGVFEIAAELGEIAERARNKKTSLDEMSGGCLTLTNLGSIGGTNFTPIVNAPEVAILGVARGGFEPVWNKEKGEFEPRMMLPLSLSYDHRVIDGADGARFLRFIAEALEEPFLLAMES